MDQLKAILREEVSWYAGTGKGVRLRLIRSLDDEHGVYAVFAVDDPNPDNTAPEIMVLAHIKDDHIVIEVDNTDRPLVYHLEERGIPRQQITLAYEGESIPTSNASSSAGW